MRTDVHRKHFVVQQNVRISSRNQRPRKQIDLPESDYEAENWYHADLDFETFKLLQYVNLMGIVLSDAYLILVKNLWLFSCVATGTRARLFGTHISGGVLRAASAHGLPPLALVVCILMKQSRQDLKYESDSEYICRAPVPGITLEKKGNAAEKEKDKEMM
ncbi:hypothetical protein CsatA_018614 [Cannabis sativa]